MQCDIIKVLKIKKKFLNCTPTSFPLFLIHPVQLGDHHSLGHDL